MISPLAYARSHAQELAANTTKEMADMILARADGTRIAEIAGGIPRCVPVERRVDCQMELYSRYINLLARLSTFGGGIKTRRKMLLEALQHSAKVRES